MKTNSITYQNGIYQGDTVNNIPHGIGNIKWENGEFYEGEWLEGKKNGKGVFIDKFGNRIEGNWVNNKLHGEAKFYSINGNINIRKYHNAELVDEFKYPTESKSGKDSLLLKKNSVKDNGHHLDGSINIGYLERDSGKYGSISSYDDYDEESKP
ncbi:MAG: hypothetical protein MUD12_15435 [Spirochaetes bacterium]|jgi:hypothetical protein|nr:hypothetical protein [Spirochaetota bacterium]